LNSGCAESKNNTVKLPEDVTTFSHLLSWVCTIIAQLEGGKPLSCLCELWVAVDRRDMPLLMNRSLNQLKLDMVRQWSCPIQELNFIYENTRPESGLRRFVMDVICHTSGMSLSDEEDRDDWHPDALWDFHKFYRGPKDLEKKWTKKEIVELDIYAYHQHEQGVTCTGIMCIPKPQSTAH
jgi:hypothetical protein